MEEYLGEKMNNVAKCAFVVALAGCMAVSVSTVNSFAQKVDNEKNDTYGAESIIVENCLSLNDIHETGCYDLDEVVRSEIKIQGQSISLYPEYSNQDQAMETIKTQCSNIIDFLRKKYSLNEINSDNWKEYYSRMPECEDIFKGDSPDDIEYAKLASFFDIYENKEKNDHLISLVTNAESINSLLNDTDFIYELPYNEANKVNIICNENGLISKNILTSYSESNAISYAIEHAESPNKKQFGYISNADCTNFVSQIMLAGGKTMTPKWMCAQVWTTFHYTSAWSNANSFANYWGVDYTFSSHKMFSSKIKKGDYITEDKAGDGDWDHMEFVVNVKSSYDPALGYINYRVAQHTNDYLAWASSSECGWDTLKTRYPKCIFGIVRV